MNHLTTLNQAKPHVSVIVPVYKSERFIRKCVNSILAQTYKDFEVILVDDGSPDRCGEICDEYARQDERVRVIHKPNGGVSSARQCGIEHAQGEYTIHVDPDDWVEADMLERLYAKAKSEGADMVICDFYVEDGSEKVLVRQQPSDLSPATVLRELFQQLHGSCCNKLVRRVCYNNYGVCFPQDLSYCEDLFVCCSLLMHGIKVAYLNQAFYHYVRNVNENSMVRTRPFEHDVLLINHMKDLLPEQLFANTALPRLSFGMAMYLWMQESVDASAFRKMIKPYRLSFLRCKTVPVMWRLVLFASAFGLKDILYGMYKKLKML